jgi:hypothetical protein
VFRAFFDRAALATWWQASASITTPRVMGPYVIEWPSTSFRDETLGRLGGTLRGSVLQADAGAGFFVADLYWLPPDGDPIGPMALEVTCSPLVSETTGEETTLLHVLQTGFENSARWRRYYIVFGASWERALETLKGLLEP